MGPMGGHQAARRVTILLPVMGNRAHPRGRIGRAEGGRADLGDLASRGSGHDRQTVDVRGAALIRPHAKRGIALEMFDRDIVFPRRKLHVRGFHIVLQIDEHLLGAARRGLPHRHDLAHAQRHIGQRRIAAVAAIACPAA